jgi:hypothetical protein
MDRHGNEQIPTCPDSLPAHGQDIPEDGRQTAFAGVLEVVQRTPDDAFEGRTPLELDQRGRDVPRQTEEHATRPLDTREQPGPAALAHGQALRAAA